MFRLLYVLNSSCLNLRSKYGVVGTLRCPKSLCFDFSMFRLFQVAVGTQRSLYIETSSHLYVTACLPCLRFDQNVKKSEHWEVGMYREVKTPGMNLYQQCTCCPTLSHRSSMVRHPLLKLTAKSYQLTHWYCIAIRQSLLKSDHCSNS